MTPTIRPSVLYLWPKRTLYIGPLFEPITMKNGAASFEVALDGPMSVSFSDREEPVICNSFLVPPGVNFTANTGDSIVANCMLDALGIDYAALYGEMSLQGKDRHKDLSFSVRNEAGFIQGYLDIYTKHYSSASAFDKLEQLLTPPERLARIDHPVDHRVVRVIDLIKQNIEENMSIEALAQSVNLSVPRLVQIFKAQTGVPIRRYRKWHRLYVTCVLMTKADNLTEAAMRAGFTDGVHFAHTFQKMLGMRASLLLNQPNKIRVVAEANDVSPFTEIS